jgi:hypothetical protein
MYPSLQTVQQQYSNVLFSMAGVCDIQGRQGECDFNENGNRDTEAGMASGELEDPQRSEY